MTHSDWKKTACILCSLNCGLQVRTGGDNGRRILSVKGDRDHPVSRGYVCNKALRLDYYQNSADRIKTPLRRTAEGTYEPVDWDTAIKEVAAGLAKVRDQHGGDKILYYGGGGQGNHLGGAYSIGLLKALGVRYKSNALAQEKTGEFWVAGKMMGTGTHGDFEHCEVALVIGKNPWQSHGLARARDVINAIRKDPKRSLVVIDPRRSETAARADYHLAVKPGTDAWCLAALVAILVQEQLDDQDWVGRHCVGADEVRAWFRQVDVATCAHHCGIAPDQLYAVARRIAKASSVASIEDLGVQMNHHSTLNSWLHRLIWLLTGNFGIRGGNNTPVPYLGLGEASKGDVGPRRHNPYKTSPVLGSKVIIGLIPCNNIPDEILTDHPNRFRALIVESGNPVHSLADSPRMRAAMRALDFSVVIDVAMTETARQADYVLPAASQYEKTENSFFNLEYPRNSFHLRKRLFPPLEGTLVEAEIHTRLLEALGAMDNAWIRPLSLLARHNRAAFAAAFLLRAARDKAFFAVAANVLYRTLGPTLPDDRPEAAVHWVLSLMYSRKFKRYAANAGFRGLLAGEKLFRAILDSPSGLVFADAGDYHNSFRQIRTPGGKIQLWIPELVDELRSLSAGPPPGNPDFPLILSAGERRDETSNCIIRNPSWDTKGRLGLLRIHPEDARTCQVTEGDRVRLETPARAVEAVVTLTDSLQAGHISLPNGTGLEYPDEQGRCVRHGVAPNELTHTADRDPIAGTPWHKHVPARIEALAD